MKLNDYSKSACGSNTQCVPCVPIAKETLPSNYCLESLYKYIGECFDTSYNALDLTNSIVCKNVGPTPIVSEVEDCRISENTPDVINATHKIEAITQNLKDIMYHIRRLDQG